MFPELPCHELDEMLADCYRARAGIFFTGAAGSGKTQAMQRLCVLLARRGKGLTYVSPHESDCIQFRERMLAERSSVRDRFMEIEPCNPERMVTLQPARVHEHANPLVREARIANKVDHVARILLATSGEADFDGGPRKFAGLYRVLTEGIRAGLPLPDHQHFIEPGSSLFPKLIQAVPHVMHRLAFEQFAKLTPARQEELIEAVRNRFVRLFANRFVETLLCSMKPTFDAETIRRDSRILLLNLHPGDTLRHPEDVSVIANLYLAEMFHSIFCSSQTFEHWVCLDELPLYRATFPEITRLAPQVRKFRTPILSAAQGATSMPNGSEDRLFNALIAQCGIHVVLGHNHPADCEFFAKLVALGAFDPKREKYRLVQSQQYGAGHELVQLTDVGYSERTQLSHGGGESIGTSDSETWNQAQGNSSTTGTSSGQSETTSDSTTDRPFAGQREQLQRAIGRAAGTSLGTSMSETSNHSSSCGGARGRSHQQSTSWTTSDGKSVSFNLKSQLVPILRWRDVLSSITCYTPEEHFLEAAAQISKQKPGEALVRIGGLGTFHVQFEMALNILGRTPKARARAFVAFDERLQALGMFSDPLTLQQQRQQFLASLALELDALIAASSAAVQPRLLQRPQPARLLEDCALTNGELAEAGRLAFVLAPTDDPKSSPLSI